MCMDDFCSYRLRRHSLLLHRCCSPGCGSRLHAQHIPEVGHGRLQHSRSLFKSHSFPSCILMTERSAEAAICCQRGTSSSQ